MDIAEFKSSLKNGNFAGWYILSGEEDYLKKYYMNELRSSVALDESFALFNCVSFDGADIDFGAVAEAIAPSVIAPGTEMICGNQTCKTISTTSTKRVVSTA